VDGAPNFEDSLGECLALVKAVAASPLAAFFESEEVLNNKPSTNNL